MLARHRRKPGRAGRLGLARAISISLIGAAAVVAWLASGRLAIPVRGQVLLWVSANGLILISLVELLNIRAEQQA